MQHIAPLAADFNHNFLCPNCGESFIHHGVVEVFYRAREDGPTKVMRIERGVVTSAGYAADNPSPRRGGMLIYFFCEICGHQDMPLAIFQHKGETFWGWQ